MKNLKKISLVALIFGIIVATALVGWFGAGKVTHAILSVGWHGFGVFCLWQIAVMMFLGLPWWIVAPRGIGHAGPFVWGRMVRDSAGSCLPFSALGGFVLGARAVSLCGISWHVATISTIVDLTTEFAAEIMFAAIGLAILLIDVHLPQLRLPAEIGLGVAMLALGAVIRLQHGIAPMFAALGKRLLGPWIAEGRIDLGAEAELAATYGRKRILALGTAMHLIGWVGKGTGNWLAFHLLGVDMSFPAALAIEGLLHVALVVAVVIPGYAGVQEAGYIVLGGIFGAPADLCLAVSLIRRARDIAIGIPVLLVWQMVEVRRLKRRSPDGVQ